MEYILIALFGGGTLDWQDISKTEYDWEDIFEEVKINYNMNEIDMNVLYSTILELALSELSCAMREYEGKKSKDFLDCEIFTDGYFEIYCNYLDTHLTFTGSKELWEELQDKLGDKIEEINNKIGFTYIEF